MAADRDTALAEVEVERAAQVAADLALVKAVVAWAVEHQLPTNIDPDPESGVFGPSWIDVAGEGAPLIDEFAMYELATTLGRSVDSTRSYLASILETRYRLPRLWARVAAGEVLPWRAFKIALRTQTLTAAGARHVDAALAHVAHSTTLAQIERSVTAALTAYDPDEATRRVAAAKETRHVFIDLDPQLGCYAGLTAVIRLDATLDAEDALDLERAIRGVATQLGTLGSDEPMDIRRAHALGEIARGQLALDLPADGPATGRDVTLYAHLHPDDATAQVEASPLTGSVLIDQIRGWCQQAGTSVKVHPVIDLADDKATTSYTPTVTQKRQIGLRDEHCVAPYCTTRVAGCDQDHVHPHADGGPTSSHNLALLCRRHHRAKTHHPGWTYQMLHPGTYLWALPSGRRFRVDRHGTRPDPD